MSVEKHITNHLYALFSYLSDNSTPQLTIKKNVQSIRTKDSSWPNFIFNTTPNDETLTCLTKQIANNELPKHIIINSSDIDTYETELTNNNFFPIAEWSCLQLAHDQVQVNPQSKLNILKITSELELKKWVKVASTGFNELSFELFNNCLNNKEISFYGGYLNDKMVSTALIFNHQNTTGIYHVVTLPEEKGKGFGSDIFSFCEQEALRTGAQQVIAQSTTDGLNAWLKTGMKAYGNFYLFCWNKPKQ